MELWAFIIIVCLYLFLTASELIWLSFDLNKEERIGTGVIGIKHEDMFQHQRRDFLSLGVPEDTRIERLAILAGKQDQSEKNG